MMPTGKALKMLQELVVPDGSGRTHAEAIKAAYSAGYLAGKKAAQDLADIREVEAAAWASDDINEFYKAGGF